MDTKADQVFEQGHWEYGYLFRSAPGAFEYASLKFGAWMLELQSRLKAKISGSNKVGGFSSLPSNALLTQPRSNTHITSRMMGPSRTS
jgi:hypothetical protein